VPNVPTADDLLRDMETDAEQYFDRGKNNNIIDISLTIAAIVSSLAAASVAATDVQRFIRVGVAAIPAAFTSIQKVVEVKARSNWYFNYATRLRVLAATLQYSQNPDLEDFAKQRANIDLEMEQAWGQIGQREVKPVTKGKK
jgi:hypothetical protein